MLKKYTLRVLPPHVRKLADPTNDNIVRTVGYVEFGQLPFDVSYKPNPRTPTEKSLRSSVAKDIKQSAIEARGKFHLLNGGVFILADDIDYDNQRGLLHFTVGEEQGLINGGHTLRIIKEVLDEGFTQDEDPKRVQYCNFEIQTNVNPDDLSEIAAGRNSTVALKQKTLLEYENAFAWIKDALAQRPYADRIGYVENHDKPEDIERIVCRLTAVNPVTFDDSHPIVAYTSKKKCMELLEAKKDEYLPLAPLVPDVLELYEYLVSKAKDVYAATVDRNKFLQMDGGVTNLANKKADILPLSGTPVSYRVADGWLIPLLAAFRSLIKINDQGKAHWTVDPKLVYDRVGGKLIRILYESGLPMGRNPNAVGKTENVYRQLYEQVDSERKSILLEQQGLA